MRRWLSSCGRRSGSMASRCAGAAAVAALVTAGRRQQGQRPMRVQMCRKQLPTCHPAVIRPQLGARLQQQVSTTRGCEDLTVCMLRCLCRIRTWTSSSSASRRGWTRSTPRWRSKCGDPAPRSCQQTRCGSRERLPATRSYTTCMLDAHKTQTQWSWNAAGELCLHPRQIPLGRAQHRT